MATLKNDVFLRALLREPVPYTPVWLMRQAGRYLPEYRATRAKAGSFLALAKTPSLATEVTLQPLARYKLDAAILFSDILTVPDAMGLGLYFADGEGPKFERPLRGPNAAHDIAHLPQPDIARDLKYVTDAVGEIRRALDGAVPLIGFSGSPFTLACYMVEGGGSDDFRHIKTLLLAEPALAHTLLEKNAQAVANYLNAQIEAGAQAVQIFDTWGGALPAHAYRTFSLHYMESVIARLIKSKDGRRVPCIVFTKGGGQWLEAIAAIGCDAVGLDWTTDLGAARARVSDAQGHMRVALQGNLDPMALFAPPEAIAREVQQALQSFGMHGGGRDSAGVAGADVGAASARPGSGAASGHVFNLGHGISQFTPPEHVTAMLDALHAASPAFHAKS
jgi:uroporphyrinogen decarboxylase